MDEQKKGKILIIDDSFINNILVEDIFQDAGYEVIIFNTGRSAIERVIEVNPDIILLDIMMPKVSGIDVLTELKANEKTKEIPVLMISADSTSESKRKTKDLGAIDYIHKPFIPYELIATVEHALKRSKK
jgi:DNA-binding response OmpR family regulator